MYSKEHVVEEFLTFIVERGASSRPKKAKASVPFRLASRSYGSAGTVEQDSYSDTPPEEEIEKGQTILRFLKIFLEDVSENAKISLKF